MESLGEASEPKQKFAMESSGQLLGNKSNSTEGDSSETRVILIQQNPVEVLMSLAV